MPCSQKTGPGNSRNSSSAPKYSLVTKGRAKHNISLDINVENSRVSLKIARTSKTPPGAHLKKQVRAMYLFDLSDVVSK